MNDLFSNNVQDSCIKIDMQDADVVLYPELFSQEEADNFFNKLNGEIQSSNFHERKDGLIEQIQSA